MEHLEQILSSTLRQAPVGITIFRGNNFVVEMANTAYLEIVDRPAESFIGRPLFDSLPEVREAVEPLLRGVITTGVPYYGNEFPVTLNRFGRPGLTYFNFIYQPLVSTDGAITGVIVVAMEVTDSVKAKHMLTESERKFRNLVMQSPIPLAIFRGENFVIELANKVMFRNIWRKKEADIIGKSLLEVFPELQSQKYPDLLRQTMATGKIHKEVESYALVAGDDGMKAFYLDFEYAPLREDDGSVSGIMVTVNDVTPKVEARQQIMQAEESARQFAQKLEVMVNDRTRELAAANQELKRTNIELERSNADLEKFAYAASHDMKEPVRKISFFAGLLSHNLPAGSDEKLLGYVSKIDNAASRMTALIRDLLTYAKTTDVPRVTEKVDLQHLITQVRTDLEVEIAESDARITYEGAATIDVYPGQIQQALQNILSNAIKFRRSGQAPVILISNKRVSSEEAGLPGASLMYDLIEIRDNGIGFSKDESEKIFDVFTRLHNRAQYSGTGVGLSIVRKVMDNHRGFVKAIGEPGKGATFQLFFPVRDDEAS